MELIFPEYPANINKGMEPNTAHRAIINSLCQFEQIWGRHNLIREDGLYSQGPELDLKEGQYGLAIVSRRAGLNPKITTRIWVSDGYVERLRYVQSIEKYPEYYAGMIYPDEEGRITILAPSFDDGVDHTVRSWKFLARVAMYLGQNRGILEGATKTAVKRQPSNQPEKNTSNPGKNEISSKKGQTEDVLKRIDEVLEEAS